MNADYEEMEITLPLLEQVNRQHDITQRSLSERLNLALGLTNSYLKHCIKKGLIKIEQVPANRYFYYLTPKGFTEKSRLTAKYLKSSLEFYRHASESCFQLFRCCQEADYKQAVICGVSDLAEIAILQAARAGIALLGVYDEKHKLPSFYDLPVLNEVSELPNNTAYVITTISHPIRMKKKLEQHINTKHVFAPSVLRL